MKLYKSLEIVIKNEREGDTNALVQELAKNVIYVNWTHVKSIKNSKHTILIEIIESETDDRFNEIEEFIKLINKSKIIIDEFKMSQLCIRIDYEYEEQCNMEFHPNVLKKLGENGIILCISCWKK